MSVMTSVKTIVLWGILLLFVLSAGTACNTLEGAGEDVERTGEKVRDAAD